MEITDTLAPKSEQLDGIELVGGPRTFTIDHVVVKGEGEQQPVDIWLKGFPRPWRPNVTMRRVIVFGWGGKTEVYAGRRVTLFYDPEVMFGKEKPGGTRLSHMSDLPNGRAIDVPVLVGKGRSALYHVEPLTESQPVPETEPTADQVAACTDLEELRAMYDAAGSPERRAQIRARKAELLEFDGPNIGGAAS